METSSARKVRRFSKSTVRSSVPTLFVLLVLGQAGFTHGALAQIPTQSLKLWLRADAGITLNSGRVSRWRDQSGTGTDARQNDAASQPTFLSVAVNSKPAVRFDGVGDFMTFTLPVNGLTGMTLVLVSACALDLSGTSIGVANAPLFWNETAQWGTVHLSPFQRMAKFRFGTGQTGNLPAYTRPASIGNNYSLTVAIKDGVTETLFVNGARVLTQTGKLATIGRIRDVGNLGRGYNDDTYFAGDIAEVLVYTRALSDTERLQVEGYLTAKYFGVAPPPPVNEPPKVSAGQDQTVTLPAGATLGASATDDGLPNGTLTTTWSKVSGPGTVTFGNGNALTTTAWFSTAGTYVLRLTATDSELVAADELNIVVNTSSTPPPSVPTQNLKLWLRADAGVTLDGSTVSLWADQSGGGANATQTAATSQPAFATGAINGKPTVRFDGINDFMTFTLPLNGLTGMTLVLVSACSLDVDGTVIGVEGAPIFWNETAGWGTVHLSPFQRMVKFRFGTGQYNNLPAYNRPASIGGAYSLTTATKNGATESLFVNGTQVLNLGGKLATIGNIRDIGNLGRGYNDNTYFPGEIAEVLVYTRALSDTERVQVEQYLMTKYFGATPPPPPPPPTNQGPTVNAGPDQTITLPASATLNGTATDDGLPSGILTTTWSKVSGPGTVTFGNVNALSTTASFSAAGTYVLWLAASDSLLTASDDVAIVVAASPPSSGGVPIAPGENIQGAVNAYPAATAFLLKAGVHRMQSIVPKNGNIFLGEHGTILSGSKLLASFTREGIYWVATGQTQEAPVDTAAKCVDQWRCTRTEELFFDDKRLKHVGTLAAVAPGSWFFDYAADKIYLIDDPAGHKVETSITRYAFSGSATTVTIKSLVVEKYANLAGTGGIFSASADWVIEGNEVRLNHGGGIHFGARNRILRNKVHHNGQIGIVGQGADALVDGNEIDHNNDAGFYYGWEAGGSKFLRTTNLVVRNNYVHDNRGPGLWTDFDNWHATYEGNRTARNKDGGLVHELSFDATMRYNIIEDDGFSEFGTGLWHGAGISNVKSRRVQVYGNTLINCANGIGGAQDSRTGSSPTSGETFDVRDFNVHDNVIVQKTGGVAAGIVRTSDYDDSIYTSWNNRYVDNTYKLDSLPGKFYQWQGGLLTREQWKAAGNDTTGVWIASTDLSFPSTKFAAGARITVTAPVQVRSLPSNADGVLLGTQPAGNLGTITMVRGPIYSGGFWWWQVDYDSGPDGWSIQDSLQ